jgi:hypothetical protein
MKRKWEKRDLGERKREKARRNPKIVLRKVFVAINQQETREKRRKHGRQSEILKRESRLWMRKIMDRKPG